MRDHLFNPDKLKYVKGEKPDVDCILCAIRDRSDKVTGLEVFRNNLVLATVNLYPFNPGHLMIFPMRHVTAPGDMTDGEAMAMHELLVRTIDILDEEFSPSGYNIGFNIGDSSGASIPHIHQHIVPRYPNEVGFLDVMAGTRIVVSDPAEVMERLKKRFDKI